MSEGGSCHGWANLSMGAQYIAGYANIDETEDEKSD